MASYQVNDCALRVAMVSLLAIVPLQCCHAAHGSADEWAPRRAAVFADPHGTYVARVSPSPAGAADLSLLRVAPEGNHECVWSVTLPYTPERAVVSSRGTLATLNQYARPGYRHSVVIWNSHGHTVCDYSLDDLLPSDDVALFFGKQVASRFWLHTAHVRFAEPRCDLPGELLQLTFNWGRQVIINAATGRVHCARLPSASVPKRGHNDTSGSFVILQGGREVGSVACTSKNGRVKCDGTILEVGVRSDVRIHVSFNDAGEWTDVDYGNRHEGLSRSGMLATIRTADAPDLGTMDVKSDDVSIVLKPRTYPFLGMLAPPLWNYIIEDQELKVGDVSHATLLWHDGRLVDTFVSRGENGSVALAGNETPVTTYQIGSWQVVLDANRRVLLGRHACDEQVLIRRSYIEAQSALLALFRGSAEVNDVKR